MDWNGIGELLFTNSSSNMQQDVKLNAINAKSSMKMEMLSMFLIYSVPAKVSTL